MIVSLPGLFSYLFLSLYARMCLNYYFGVSGRLCFVIVALYCITLYTSCMYFSSNELLIFFFVNTKVEEMKVNLSTSGFSQVVNELANLTASQANDSGLYSGELETVTKALDSLATMTSTNINVTEDIPKVGSTHE